MARRTISSPISFSPQENLKFEDRLFVRVIGIKKGMSTNEQLKSKKRVSDHGEVFTNEREVIAMLDLVKHETERIDSRFLEPSCGSCICGLFISTPPTCVGFAWTAW